MRLKPVGDGYRLGQDAQISDLGAFFALAAEPAAVDRLVELCAGQGLDAGLPEKATKTRVIYMHRFRSMAFVVALLATLAVLPAPAHAAAATGGVIEGTLTTADGSAPVAGARLQIKAYSGTPSYLLPEAVTDESGHYRLEPLPAGRYRIGFFFAETGDQQWAPRMTRETAATWYSVTDGGTTVVNDSLFPTGDLDVTFTNADGPIAAFCADASGGYFLRSGCTTTGTLNLRGLRSGRYAVLVWAEGETAVSPAWATITTGNLTALTVTKR